jgi:hypothetical protein
MSLDLSVSPPIRPKCGLENKKFPLQLATNGGLLQGFFLIMQKISRLL